MFCVALRMWILASIIEVIRPPLENGHLYRIKDGALSEVLRDEYTSCLVIIFGAGHNN